MNQSYQPMDELWKECNFNENYEVSSWGHIRRKGGRQLKPTKTSRGYLYVNLNKKTYSVQKLVAYAFLPACPGEHGCGRGKYHIDHIDGDKTNNAASNLQWLLHEDNVRAGTQRSQWNKRALRRQLEEKFSQVDTLNTLAVTTKADAILDRLESIEKRTALLLDIIALQKKSEGETWLDSKAFCRTVGIKDKSSLHYYMAKGVLKHPAIKNIGTPERPRYRFHRTKAVDQFLNRAAKVS